MEQFLAQTSSEKLPPVAGKNKYRDPKPDSRQRVRLKKIVWSRIFPSNPSSQGSGKSWRDWKTPRKQGPPNQLSQLHMNLQRQRGVHRTFTGPLDRRYGFQFRVFLRIMSVDDWVSESIFVPSAFSWVPFPLFARFVLFWCVRFVLSYYCPLKACLFLMRDRRGRFRWEAG